MGTLIENNRERFIGLLRDNVTRVTQEQLDSLISFLDTNGFFIAPASSQYHSAFDGGLCAHSLNVFDSMSVLVNNHVATAGITMESVTIITLLHDVDKMWTYVKGIKNEKVYKENGSKSDELGRFDWESKVVWTREKPENKFSIGTHGQNCAYIASKFIPLSDEEYAAILNHMGGLEEGAVTGKNVSEVFNKYRLASLLHVADMLSTYLSENTTHQWCSVACEDSVEKERIKNEKENPDEIPFENFTEDMYESCTKNGNGTVNG